jgi:hypothetical protein
MFMNCRVVCLCIQSSRSLDWVSVITGVSSCGCVEYFSNFIVYNRRFVANIYEPNGDRVLKTEIATASAEDGANSTETCRHDNDITMYVKLTCACWQTEVYFQRVARYELFQSISICVVEWNVRCSAHNDAFGLKHFRILRNVRNNCKMKCVCALTWHGDLFAFVVSKYISRVSVL